MVAKKPFEYLLFEKIRLPNFQKATPCQLRGGAVQPFCSEETACIASSSTKWMRMHDRISLLNVGPWFS